MVTCPLALPILETTISAADGNVQGIRRNIEEKFQVSIQQTTAWGIHPCCKPFGRACPVAALLLLLIACFSAQASDWPMLGYDAGRTANSPDSLPEQLKLEWWLELPALKPAWPDQIRVRSDAMYHPIVLGDRLIVASPLDDSVTAYRISDGKEIWRFFTGGPIRVAPAGADGRVFVGSDDGWMYALDVKKGSLIWKFKGAPQTRSVLGNERMIDTWAIRGGPVLTDGKLYFTAGIWPFMGVFVQCLDAASGKVIWTNSGDGADFLPQPHGAPSFSGIAPQGALAVTGNRLLIPNGRAVPACYDRNTGKMQYFNLASASGGDQVVAARDWFFDGRSAFNLKDGRPVAEVPASAAIVDDFAYAATPDGIASYPLGTLADPGPMGKANTLPVLPVTLDKAILDGKTIIRAGDRLFVAGKGWVASVEYPLNPDQNAQTWRTEFEGTAAGLVAGGEKLFVSTEEGRIYCFGNSATTRPVKPSMANTGVGSATRVNARLADRARAILADSHANSGYALAIGADSEPLVRALVAKSALDFVILDSDAARCDHLRRQLQHDGLYGDRIAIKVADLSTAAMPPYFAALVVGDDKTVFRKGGEWCEQLYRSMHPYQGVAYLALDPEEQSWITQLASAKWNGHSTTTTLSGDLAGSIAGMTRLARTGGVPGGGNWTHEHADAANTRVSKDQVVKTPLGVLWFGGSSNEGTLPRHGHGPMPQVVDGRCILEGVDSIRALDIYTGRVLWETSLPGVGSYYNNTAHQVGANGAGPITCRCPMESTSPSSGHAFGSTPRRGGRYRNLICPMTHRSGGMKSGVI